MICGDGESGGPSAAQVQRIVEMAYDLLVVVDDSGIITYVNGATRHLLGYEPDDLLGTFSGDLVHPDDLEHALVSLNHHRGRIHTPRIIARLAHRDGSWIPLELTANNAFDRPDISGLVISAREAVAPARDNTDSGLVQLLYALLHHVNDGVLACDAHQHITVMNRSMSRLLGLDDGSAQPLRLPDGVELLPAEGTVGPEDGLLERPLSGQSVSDEEWLIRRPDNSVRRVVVNAQPLIDGADSAYGSVLVFKDVTEQRSYVQELLHLATHDPLTGLANRRLLLQRLQDALDAGTDERTTVLICDVDHFKEINDTYGHDHGDHLLIQLSQRLQDAAHPGDTLARLGGDEFVLVTQAADEASAQATAQRMVDAFREPLQVAGHDHPVSISVGWVIADHGDTAEQLLRQSDVALYLAKERGGRRFERFEDDHSLSTARRLVARELLVTSLGAGQVHLNFQPIVMLGSGRISGAEALVRLPSPDGPLMLPDQFLEIARRSGLQGSLDLAVLNEAVAATVRLHRGLGQPIVGLTCNMSARQLSGQNLADQVLHCLNGHGMSPGLLSIDLASYEQLEIDGSLQANLFRLSDAGVWLGLDNFGVAPGSLRLLLDLPFAYVKIDRSLLPGLPRDERTRAILSSVMQLASRLGLDVRAEGVERPEQAEALKELGVGAVQGFLFWPPLSEGGYADVVQAQASSRAALTGRASHR